MVGPTISRFLTSNSPILAALSAASTSFGVRLEAGPLLEPLAQRQPHHDLVVGRRAERLDGRVGRQRAEGVPDGVFAGGLRELEPDHGAAREVDAERQTAARDDREHAGRR